MGSERFDAAQLFRLLQLSLNVVADPLVGRHFGGTEKVVVQFDLEAAH